jgi:hypothetical protein
MLGFRDQLPDQHAGFAIQKLLSEDGGRISSTRRTPFWIAAAALWKGTTSLCRRYSFNRHSNSIPCDQFATNFPIWTYYRKTLIREIDLSSCQLLRGDKENGA